MEACEQFRNGDQKCQARERSQKDKTPTLNGVSIETLTLYGETRYGE